MKGTEMIPFPRQDSNTCRIPMVPSSNKVLFDSTVIYLKTRGATDHKTHGSDCVSVFESPIRSFFGSAKL